MNIPVEKTNWEAFFQRAQFHITVDSYAGLPPDRGIEVAFAGRSNAGKSSAINVLTQRNRLAYSSKTPGRTQHINYFSVGEEGFLVDLPGYGYAEVPKAVKLHWQRLLADYLASREALKGLVLLMDIRHPLTVLDEQLLEWFLPRQKPVIVLLTKADKLGRSARAQTVRSVRQALAERGATMTVIPFSSLDREGLEPARQAVGELFREERPTQAISAEF
ncbi:ribosome biogenesis GTP-binding protein YihA/YsxC [Ferrovum sp.]|uniref:ribosome biogenesis GTP-binding protein YihA/YsxC n=1 Tax=Ferrovum sp. TaxID=2609467 RepID=UPI00261614E5|nr:ribosome biogenesis GTP-binding protein YihA/YsxC [Ferrovum sp.]